MQNEIKEKCVLLDKDGNLAHPGYSKSMLQEYSRKDIRAKKSRIKEWDYYLIYNNNYAVALTVADNGYMGLHSASLIDLSQSTEKTTSVMTALPMGKTNMPPSSKTGDVHFKNKRLEAKFEIKNKNRYLYFEIKNFKDKKTLICNFKLTDEPKESMVIATPFDKPKHFYYNQKIVGFKASGTVQLGDEIIDFNEDDTLAILDWGRGVWTYKNTWFWGAGCGYVNNELFGFNIGYGFGNTKNASENCIFYKGKMHKLDQVVFSIPKGNNGKDNYLSDWKFGSNDGRFEMDFKPIINRHANANALLICSLQNQVFGKFNGTAVLDDGTKIELKNFVGFAEKVFNKW